MATESHLFILQSKNPSHYDITPIHFFYFNKQQFCVLTSSKKLNKEKIALLKHCFLTNGSNNKNLIVEIYKKGKRRFTTFDQL